MRYLMYFIYTLGLIYCALNIAYALWWDDATLTEAPEAALQMRVKPTTPVHLNMQYVPLKASVRPRLVRA